MTSTVETPEAAGQKSFSDLAKKFKAKSNHVLAILHVGAPAQYPTEHGTETAYDGDYVVQVGWLEKVETVPPDKEKGKAGHTKKAREPKLEVMKAEDFLELYEA
jgi:hypothetical protein